ncbi:MAG: hypothetical protein J6Y52_07935 [Bacteroidales bacterium]|nr:hypothetical protein [Bacteroidales bacterium]
MMAKTTGLLLNGSLKSEGITFYQKNGQIIVRSVHSNERRSNTRGQFVQRQRMRHTTALWQMLKVCHPMFSGGKSAYARFATLANRMPPVFVPCSGPIEGASFLMPDMPVSEGSLPTVKLWLGEVAGVPALMTNLKPDDLQSRETFRLYIAKQCIEGQTPRLRFLNVRDVEPNKFVESDGCLALTGGEFADTMMGWALIRMKLSPSTGTRRCSTQSIVTRCTLYEQYTTEEALQTAAKSYGGLTERPGVASTGR